MVERLLLVVGEGEKEEIVTAAEQLMQRGLEKGRTEGRVMERREMLLDLLRARFGVLDPTAEARVLAADPDQLKGWMLRIVKAATMDEVFAEE
ncbi:MAG: hypothetical protein QM820_30995 [Minicystis sp.]